jgi:hypothetical protein
MYHTRRESGPPGEAHGKTLTDTVAVPISPKRIPSSRHIIISHASLQYTHLRNHGVPNIPLRNNNSQIAHRTCHGVPNFPPRGTLHNTSDHTPPYNRQNPYIYSIAASATLFTTPMRERETSQKCKFQYTPRRTPCQERKHETHETRHRIHNCPIRQRHTPFPPPQSHNPQSYIT